MKKVFTLLAVVSILTSACTQEKASKEAYYPIDSLVHSQALYLAEAKAMLTKHAAINGKEETNTFSPKDTTAWLHELDIFMELKSINKPINRGSYKVTDKEKDVTSNLTVLSFTSSKTLPVVYLKVYYLQEPSKVRKVEAFYREENSLLKGTRYLVMEFQEVYNKTVLTNYSIEGGQKMFIGDSVHFSVKGTVTIP